MESRCERGISLKMDSSFPLFLLSSLELAEHPGKEAKGEKGMVKWLRKVPMPTFPLADNGVPSVELNNGSQYRFPLGTNMLSL